MNGRVTRLQQAFMARPRRERWLLVAAVWALLAWLGLLLFEQTLQAGGRGLQAEQQRLQRELGEQGELSDQLNRRIQELNANDARQQIERLNRQLSRLNENVEQRMRTLVGPEQMAALLLSVLEQGEGLTLMGLVNQPPQPVDTGEGATLYRHGLSLQLRGSYLDLLDYVQRLERLSGRIFWQSLSFELDRHPDGDIRLDFFTISQHRELLRG